MSRSMRQFLQVLFCAGFFTSLGLAQFNFGQYRPATLDSLTKRHQGLMSKKNDLNLAKINPHYRVTVLYGDSIRPTELNTERLIKKWFKSVLRQDYLDGLFSKEMLFFENDTTYWIPVEQSLIEYFEEEVSPGDRVEIYMTLIGATKKRLVLTLNEFKKLE